MHGGNILIVDDETKLRGLLRRIISLEGHRVFEAADIKSAAKLIDREDIEVVVCDVKLPDGNGIDFTRSVREKTANVEIILLTAYGNITDGVKAIKNGAFDYIMKGDDNDKLLPLIAHAIEKSRLQKRVWQLEQQVSRTLGFENIIGETPVIQEAVALARKVAPSNTTVLLLGETGTGKELFANGIHVSGPRAFKPFIALNCSSFSKDLLESELFGHKAGAFTGAIKDKRGLIEEANGGTLFLDEIGEMSIGLQAKLLRVLETNEFIKVGDTVSTHADVRVISATNRDLQAEVATGKFREDLFYRLNVFSMQIPALRERKKDIPLLASHFIKIFSGKMNKNIEGMTDEFLRHLELQPWKGNVRELKNTIERAVIMADRPLLSAEDLPVEIRLAQPETLQQQPLSAFDMASVEKLHIQRVLNHTKGNKTEAARLLNIGLTTLYRKIEEYRLSEIM
jgi:DNA-binding NtrC family response regulator